MTTDTKILIATDVVADAELVRKLLSDEFENISHSTNPDLSLQDFEQRRPDVLVLAFNSLERSERYYLGLYRLSRVIHAIPHRTVILCRKDDLRRVYELCKREYFDDYVLFWPMTHDASRLPMSVWHAARQIEADKASKAAPGEFAVQARRLGELEAQLAQFEARGQQRVDLASHSLRQMGQGIGAALDGFSHRLTDGELRDLVEVRDRQGFESEWGRLRREQLEPRLRQAAEAMQPVRQWVGALQHDLALPLESVRALQSLAEKVLPVVLMVDDDEIQTELMAQMLVDTKVELITAASGTEALGVLRKRRPDIVLMDIDLPDMDGFEVTRRIKSVEQFASIPVVMITGHSERDMVVASLKAGAADFVVKPFGRSTALAKLRRLVGTT